MSRRAKLWVLFLFLVPALAGAAFVALQVSLDRFEDRKGRVEGNSFFKDGSSRTTRPPIRAVVKSDGPLRRASHLDHPRTIAPGQEFAVQVRLVRPDTAEPGDPVVTLAVEGAGPWDIEVTLTSPDLDFVRGSNVGTLTLARGESSTPARFLMRAPEDIAIDRARVRVTYWHEARFFADDPSPSFLAYVFYGDANLALDCRP